MRRFLARHSTALRASTSGAAAVEFALLAPMLILILFGVLATSWVLTVQHAMQQLAAESARAALAGITSSERDGLARSYVTSAAPSYSFLDPRAIAVATGSNGAASSFTVTTTYDLKTSPLYTSLIHFVPLAGSTIIRQATIRQGGFQ